MKRILSLQLLALLFSALVQSEEITDEASLSVEISAERTTYMQKEDTTGPTVTATGNVVATVRSHGEKIVVMASLMTYDVEEEVLTIIGCSSITCGNRTITATDEKTRIVIRSTREAEIEGPHKMTIKEG